MTSNDLVAPGADTIPRTIRLRDLKRKARATRKRSAVARAARKRTGGEGVALDAGAADGINPLASKNLDQKGPAESALPATDSGDAGEPISANPGPVESSEPSGPHHGTPCPSDALKRKETANAGKWRDGSVRAAVYTKPLNPRMLLVTFENGSHGRVILHPSERGKFGTGAEVWATRATGGDLYVLAGRYNRFGRRVM